MKIGVIYSGKDCQRIFNRTSTLSYSLGTWAWTSISLQIWMMFMKLSYHFWIRTCSVLVWLLAELAHEMGGIFPGMRRSCTGPGLMICLRTFQAQKKSAPAKNALISRTVWVQVIPMVLHLAVAQTLNQTTWNIPSTYLPIRRKSPLGARIIGTRFTNSMRNPLIQRETWNQQM